jgi:hypothetical protein
MAEFRTGDYVVTPLGRPAMVVGQADPTHIRVAYLGQNGKPLIHWESQSREEVDLPPSILRRK